MKDTTTERARAFASERAPQLVETLYWDAATPPPDAEEVIRELLEAAYAENDGDQEAASEDVYDRVMVIELAYHEAQKGLATS